MAIHTQGHSARSASQQRWRQCTGSGNNSSNADHRADGCCTVLFQKWNADSVKHGAERFKAVGAHVY
jgi:hypothetical protein